MRTLEERINALKQIIAEHDGENIADPAFRRETAALISAFYDDIGRITTVPAGALFDLFIMKTLYVERRSRDAAIVDYLGAMLTRHLYTRELFPVVRDRRLTLMYLSDLLEEMRQPVHFQNSFEACRGFADNALFITGVLPRALSQATSRYGRSRLGFVDTGDYVRWGKTYYQQAAEHDLAEFTQQRETLFKLSRHFEVYMEALNEASEQYILGLDMNVITDKMLDCFNRYRQTGEQVDLDNARKFAALLKVDSDTFPALFKRTKARPVLLQKPGA